MYHAQLHCNSAVHVHVRQVEPSVRARQQNGSADTARCVQDQVEQLAEQLALPECTSSCATDRLIEIIGEACGMAQCLCAINPLAMLRLQSHRLDRPLEAPEDSAPAVFWDGVLVSRVSVWAPHRRTGHGTRPCCTCGAARRAGLWRIPKSATRGQRRTGAMVCL